MKKYIFILTILSLISISCSEEFLELSPQDAANTNDFYITESDFNVALIGAYGAADWDELFTLSDVRSDNATAFGNQSARQRISEFNADATARTIAGLYTNSYRAIQAANAIIDRIGAANFEQVKKDEFLGEAKFIRALSYFYLLNTYGDIPLILEETTGANLDEVKSIPRTPVDEVYDQIILDLMDAEEKAPSFSTPNRASKLSAKALLGKVYLFQKEFNAAVTKLNEVIVSGQFALEPVYADLFEIGNAGNVESIFVEEYVGSANGTGTNLAFMNTPEGQSVGPFVQPSQSIYIELNLNEAYSADDDRRNMSAFSFFAPGDQGAINDTVYVTNKYKDDNPFEQNNASANFYILRYADVLLMMAEALNELGYSQNGDAFSLLNVIRERAGLNPLDATSVPDQGAFREAINLERRLELAMEGDRWYQLLRTGSAIEAINMVNPLIVTINQNDLLYPIPQGEIDVNPDIITQNPGY